MCDLATLREGPTGVCVCESREYIAGRLWLVWACDVTSSNSHLIFPLQVKFFFLTKSLSRFPHPLSIPFSSQEP